MHLRTVCGFCFVFVLMHASISWSWKMSHYEPVTLGNNEVLCATSPANKTLNAIASRAECMSACAYVCPAPCHAVNYWTNARRCQHFYYLPTSYQLQHDCTNYQVTNLTAVLTL